MTIIHIPVVTAGTVGEMRNLRLRLADQVMHESDELAWKLKEELRLKNKPVLTVSDDWFEWSERVPGLQSMPRSAVPHRRPSHIMIGMIDTEYNISELIGIVGEYVEAIGVSVPGKGYGLGDFAIVTLDHDPKSMKDIFLVQPGSTRAVSIRTLMSLTLDDLYTKPVSDEDVVRKTIRALTRDGWTLKHVYDGDEYTPVTSEEDAVSELMNLDDAFLAFERVVTRSDGERTYEEAGVLFVFGNDPEDVISDYHRMVSDTIGPMQDAWFK